MAFTEDLITRLRADTRDYEGPIRRSTEAITGLDAAAAKVGGTAAGFDAGLKQTTAGYVKFGNAARATAMAVQEFSAGGDRAVFALSALGPQLTNVTAGLAAVGTAGAVAAASVLAVVGPIAALGAALALAYPWLSKMGEGLGDLAAGASALHGDISRTEQMAADAKANAEELAGKEHLAAREAAIEDQQVADYMHHLEKERQAREAHHGAELAAAKTHRQALNDLYARVRKMGYDAELKDEAEQSDAIEAMIHARAAEYAADQARQNYYQPVGTEMPMMPGAAFDMGATSANNYAAAMSKLSQEFAAASVSMDTLVLSTLAWTDGNATALREGQNLSTFMAGAFAQAMGAGAGAAIDTYLGASVKFVSANKKQREAAEATKLSSSEAFRAAARDAIKAMAAEAAVHAMMEFALGLAQSALSALGYPMAGASAGQHFAAAAAFAAIAGVAAAATSSIGAVSKRLPDAATGAASGGSIGGAGAAGREGGGTTVVNMNFQVTPGSNPQDYADAVERALRNSARERGRPITFEP